MRFLLVQAAIKNKPIKIIADILNLNIFIKVRVKASQPHSHEEKQVLLNCDNPTEILENGKHKEILIHRFKKD